MLAAYACNVPPTALTLCGGLIISLNLDDTMTQCDAMSLALSSDVDVDTP
jgi:hypothetical protein